MKRLALLLVWTAVVVASSGDTSTETVPSTSRTPVPTTPPTPGSTKKVTPTPETNKPDVTKPYIVHAQSSYKVEPKAVERPLQVDSSTARSISHPLSSDARPFRPSVQLLARSDSFTGNEPTYDVQLSSALSQEEDQVMLPSSQSPRQIFPVGPVTSYTTPYPFIAAANPQPQFQLPPQYSVGAAYNAVRPQHTAQLPYRPRRQPFPSQQRPAFNGPHQTRRFPNMEGGGPPPGSFNRPVRHPSGPPPQRGPPRHHPPQKQHMIYSKPPPEVVFIGDHPPPLDYEPPTVVRPRRPPPPYYNSRPIPKEDEEDIMNMLDHYIPDDEPRPVRKESKSSPLSSMMMPMMLTGLIFPFFGMMFTMLSKRRRRRDLGSQEESGASDDVDFFEDMLNRAIENLEREQEKKSA